jgi:selenide, water dikinase
MKEYNLTAYSSGAGCGCKIAPEQLEQILSNHKSGITYKNLLVGNQTNDDAAVWDLENGTALVSTVDFFMPIVNDAFQFGQIAATNALSDIYAMGAKPIFANAILGWPVNKLPLEMANQVIAGAKSICEKANIPIAGGHSIDSAEPIFGLAVNGIINSAQIKTNSKAQVGDLLFLTKPLGTGIIGTAIKRNQIEAQSHIDETIVSMCTLNQIGQAIAQIDGVTAMTDITGFGLLGHTIEMAEGAQLSAQIEWGKVPYFDFVESYLLKNIIPDNTYRNWNAYEKKVNGISDMKSFQILNDPQTSGGLLIAVKPSEAPKLIALLIENKLEKFIQPIGVFTEKTTHSVQVM